MKELGKYIDQLNGMIENIKRDQKICLAENLVPLSIARKINKFQAAIHEVETCMCRINGIQTESEV